MLRSLSGCGIRRPKCLSKERDGRGGGTSLNGQFYSLPKCLLGVPGPYTTFLSEFADFLANLVVNTDKILIVGDFNIHMDNKNDSLRSAFLSITDSIGFSQLVDLPIHCCNHTLDLVLTYGTEVSHLATMPHNPLLSDHYPITFNFPLPCNIKSDSKFSFRRTISSGAAKAFTDLLPVGLMKTPLSYLLTLIWLKLINLRTAFSSHCAKRWMLLRPLKERKFHKKSLHLGIMTIRVLSNKLCGN